MSVDRYYIHNVNPHCGPEFADEYFDGNKYCITQNELPPLSIIQMLFFFETKDQIEEMKARNPDILIDQRDKYPASAEEASKLLGYYSDKVNNMYPEEIRPFPNAY